VIAAREQSLFAGDVQVTAEWSDADGHFSPPAESAHRIKRVL
jgi:hypothetical protein